MHSNVDLALEAAVLIFFFCVAHFLAKIICKLLPKSPAARPPPPPPRVQNTGPAQAAFVYISLTQKSGKGWAKTNMDALAKLVNLQIKPPLPVPLAADMIPKIRDAIFKDVADTQFMASKVVYVAGEDRDGTKQRVLALLPESTVIFV